MESTRELLATATGQLRAAGVPTPDVDAELLLAHVTGRPRALLRMSGGTVTDAQGEAFAALVAQRARRIPLQHLTGVAPFRHLELAVGPGVFVPRPETELVVDHVLAFAAAQTNSGLLVVDLCSGSGALALSIATELPGSRVIGVELSPEAAGMGPAQHHRVCGAGQCCGQHDRADRGRCHPGVGARRVPR